MGSLLGWCCCPGSTSALCLARIPRCVSLHAPSASGLPDFSVQPDPEPFPEPRIRAGGRAGRFKAIVSGLQPPTLFYFSFSTLSKTVFPLAHQLMQRKSWEQEDGGRTFILVLGHLDCPPRFPCFLYGKCILMPQDSTCSWLAALFQVLIYFLNGG